MSEGERESVAALLAISRSAVVVSVSSASDRKTCDKLTNVFVAPMSVRC